MNRRHTIPLAGLGLTFLLLCGATAFAQREVPARVALKDHRGAIDVVLTGRRGDLIHARLGDAQAASMSIQAGDIQRLHISLPQEALGEAERAFAANRIAEAVQRMRGILQPVLPYLDLPADSIMEPTFRFGEFLRREQSWTEAIRIYRALIDNADPTVRERANAWLAYTYARNRQFAEAEARLNEHAPENPQHPGFVASALARSMLFAERGDDEAALDQAARASSLSRIDHEAHVEALFLSAEAYFRLGQIAPVADATAEVVHGFQAEVPSTSLTPEDYLAAAHGIYAQILRLFSTSPFAEPATHRLATLNPEPEPAPPASVTGPGDTP